DVAPDAPSDTDVASDTDTLDADVPDGVEVDAPMDVEDAEEMVDMGDECVDDGDCVGATSGCWQGQCIDHCDPPLRIIPDSGPDTGRVRMLARGGEFYIGALDWWANFGNLAVAGVIYDGASPSMCEIAFLVPPLPVGAHDVTVYYGLPSFMIPPDPGRGGAAGVGTSVASTEPMGDVGCTSDAMCAMGEVCERGLGACVIDVCQRTSCEQDMWNPTFCEQAMGCVPEPLRCGSPADCRLIYSSCGCQAVHVDDPRTQLTSCGLGACTSCFVNHCTTENIGATCVDGVCVEQ